MLAAQKGRWLSMRLAMTAASINTLTDSGGAKYKGGLVVAVRQRLVDWIKVLRMTVACVVKVHLHVKV